MAQQVRRFFLICVAAMAVAAAGAPEHEITVVKVGLVNQAGQRYRFFHSGDLLLAGGLLRNDGEATRQVTASGFWADHNGKALPDGDLGSRDVTLEPGKNTNFPLGKRRVPVTDGDLMIIIHVAGGETRWVYEHQKDGSYHHPGD